MFFVVTLNYIHEEIGNVGVSIRWCQYSILRYRFVRVYLIL